MSRRVSAFAMAFLVLLGALHQGVHLLESAAHGEACPHEAATLFEHEHSHAGHVHHHNDAHAVDRAIAQVDASEPLFADPAHTGHTHHCSVCSTPPSLPSWQAVGDIVGPAALEIVRAGGSLWAGDWLRDALPPRRGPPSVV